jgi:hypothetical protein
VGREIHGGSCYRFLVSRSRPTNTRPIEACEVKLSQIRCSLQSTIGPIAKKK